MNTLPIRIQEEFTKACMIVDRAQSVADLSFFVTEEQTIKRWGFEYPAWMHMMFEWKMRKVYLNTEEYFKEIHKNIAPGYLQAVDKAVIQISDDSGDNAFENALYAIASQIIAPDPRYKDELGLIFESKFNEKIPVAPGKDLEKLKSRMSAEAAFWRPGLKLSLTSRSSSSSVKPVVNTQTLNQFAKK